MQQSNIFSHTQQRVINVVHIESRRHPRRNNQMEFLVDIECDNTQMDSVTRQLKRQVSCLSLHEYDRGDEFPDPPLPASLQMEESFGKDKCWFSRWKRSLVMAQCWFSRRRIALVMAKCWFSRWRRALVRAMFWFSRRRNDNGGATLN